RTILLDSIQKRIDEGSSEDYALYPLSYGAVGISCAGGIRSHDIGFLRPCTPTVSRSVFRFVPNSDEGSLRILSVEDLNLCTPERRSMESHSSVGTAIKTR